MLLRGLVRGLLRGLRRGTGATFGGRPVVSYLVSGADTANQNAYPLGTITLGANELGLLFVVQNAGTANGVVNFTGTFGGTWTLVNERSVGTIRVQCFRSLSGSAQSGTVIANFAAGDVSTGCMWGAAKVAHASRSGSNGAGAIRQSDTANVAANTTATVSVPAAIRVGSVVLYCLNHSAEEGASPGTFTKLGGDVTMTTPSRSFIFAWGLAASDAPTWTTSSGSRWVAVEVQPS